MPCSTIWARPSDARRGATEKNSNFCNSGLATEDWLPRELITEKAFPMRRHPAAQATISA
jgi:hypothetical protein